MSETPVFQHEDPEYDPGINDEPDYDLEEVDEDVTEGDD